MRVLSLFILFIVLQGCVVERLLNFKHQLKNPQKYINFNQAGVLIFNAPILHLEDIELLSGVKPTRIITNKVVYDFIRPEQPNYSFTYTLIFKDKKLAIIDYPDVFYNSIESTFAFDSLSLFGQSTLPNGNNWTIGNENIEINDVPTKDDIEQVFGPPTIINSFSNEMLYHYHYKHPTKSGLQHIKVSLSFNKKTNRATQLFLQLPDRSWKINL
ncbi:MAG: hypothetical protein VXX85_02925 [Candidatus Margulisiibacteriota bacterium]|nr:hypothetical protein [Candidatus Margulisiibacteriota bacterium]